jgi:FkbM family methyltransferase
MNTYVQIGANVGNDEFQRMIEGLTESVRVVLVEPNVQLLNELQSNYSTLSKKHNIIYFNKGISVKEGEANLHLYGHSGLSSLMRRKTYPHLSGSITIETVKFSTMCELLEINEIFQLSIDTEGLDCEILESIDLNKIKIREIIFEEWPHENDDMDNLHKTGEVMLQKIKEKYKNYAWEKISYGGMASFKLTNIE